MNKINKILEEVLTDIKPSKKDEQKILNEINGILKKINSGLNNAKAVLGGSGAKGTWLKTFDADIFVLFDYNKFKDKDGKLSDILEKHLKKKFKLTRIHGSRDYFQIKANNMTIEIIPLLNIKNESQAKNITDISQLHSNWVKKHKKQDEIRLTKQFCKAIGAYGAESYIQGFSGYVCEILTINYSSFLNLVKNAAKWKDKEVIDPENYFKGKDVFKELNLSKLVSPLIIIDPVQKSRNAAAAISYEKFDIFRKACNNFLKNPSKKYFEEKILDLDSLKRKYSNKKIIKMEVSPKKPGKRDVVGSKILKAFEFLIKESMKYGFEFVRYEWEWDEEKNAKYILIAKKEKIPKETTIIGPPLRLKEHVEKFKKAHKKTFKKGNKIMAIEKREFDSAEKLIKSLTKNKYFSEKVKLNNIGVY